MTLCDSDRLRDSHLELFTKSMALAVLGVAIGPSEYPLTSPLTSFHPPDETYIHSTSPSCLTTREITKYLLLDDGEMVEHLAVLGRRCGLRAID